MKPLALSTTTHTNFTSVSNCFMDVYMPKASGEFVKIYLYLLRCLTSDAFIDNCNIYKNGCDSYSNLTSCFCISFLADKFNLTDNDIMRAIKYWEKEGLLTLTYSENEELEGIIINEISAMSQPPVVTPLPVAKAEPKDTIAKTSKKKVNVKNLEDDEEFSLLLYITEKYIGKTLSSTDTDSIIFLYDTLNMSVDLIEFLIEYCVSKGHKSFKYMEKVAINWSNNNITTVDAAKESIQDYSDCAYSVLKAFGISGRNIAPIERDYIKKWSDTLCFDADVIIEACNRTIQATHQPSFEYADSILNKWSEKGIKSLVDIKKLDEEFEKAKKATANSSTSTTARKNTNKFNNYSQRELNLDELEKTIISKKLI